MASESADPIERWTAKRRMTLVVSLLKGETSVADAARTHGLNVAEVRTGERSFCWGPRTRGGVGAGMKRP